MKLCYILQDCCWGKKWTSLAVQQLRFCTSHAQGKGTIPDQRTKIPHAAQHGKTKNQHIYTHNKKTKKGQNTFQINSD